MARRTRGRIPAAGCNRAGNAARRPFLLSPIGLRVFLDLACVSRAGQPSEARQPAESSPQGDAKHRQHRCGYCQLPSRLGQAKNPAATRHFVIVHMLTHLFPKGIVEALPKTPSLANWESNNRPSATQESHVAGISKATRLCDILDRVENLPPLITWWLTQAAPLWQKLPDNCPLRVAHVAVVLLSVVAVSPKNKLGRRISG